MYSTVYRIRHVGRFGVHQLYFVVILCLVRLAFPVEFGFTKDVAFREFYNLMVPFLFERYVGPLCIADWLGIIWGVVAVVLPVDLSPDQAYYSVIHEYGHIVRRDIEAIRVTDLFCNLVWWNPFAYLLRSRMEETLELGCDDLVIRVIESAEKVDYLQTIVVQLQVEHL